MLLSMLFICTYSTRNKKSISEVKDRVIRLSTNPVKEIKMQDNEKH